jgi:hypothetical protein
LIRPNPMATKPILVTILNLKPTPRRLKLSLVGIKRLESICIAIGQLKSLWFIEHLGCSLVIEIDFGRHVLYIMSFKTKFENFLFWRVWLGLSFNDRWFTFGRKCSFFVTIWAILLF